MSTRKAKGNRNFLFVPDSSDEECEAPPKETKSISRKTQLKGFVGEDKGDKYYSGFLMNGVEYKVGEVLSISLPKRVTRSMRSTAPKLCLIDCCWEDKESKHVSFRTFVHPEHAPNGRRPFHGQRELIEIEAEERELSQFEPGEHTKYVVEPLVVYSKRDIFPAHVYYTNSPLPSRASLAVTLSRGKDEDEDEDVCFTPTKRRRLMRVLDSDDETKEEDLGAKDSPIRRSSRIPEMKSRKTLVHDILEAGKSKKKLFGENDNEDDSNDGNNESDGNSNSENNENTDENERGENKERRTCGGDAADKMEDNDYNVGDLGVGSPLPEASQAGGVEVISQDASQVCDLTNESSTGKQKKHRGRTKDMSWIERMESGLTRPSIALTGTRKSLEFAKPTKSQHLISTMFSELHSPSSNKAPKDTYQPSLKGFLRHVEKKSSTSEKKNKHKSGDGGGFIPELIFNADVDPKDHLEKQRMLQKARKPTRESTPHKHKDKVNSVNMDESDAEQHDSEYEDDDFIVADDAPIEKYEDDTNPDSGEEDDSRVGAANEEGDGDVDGYGEGSCDGSLVDQPIFEHTFTNREAFVVYLQYLISAYVDTDFINMMRDGRDKYFFPARRKIRDLVCSRKDSLVRSSAWAEGFQNELEQRPWYRSWSDNMELVDCEACHRSNHPCSFKVALSGAKYNATYFWDTTLLEPAEHPEGPTTKSKKEEQDVVFLLGRFCHSRTNLFHRLHHFPFHLYEKVKKKVKQYDNKCNAAPSATLVNEILDNKAWVDECADKFRNLLHEADTFMQDGADE